MKLVRPSISRSRDFWMRASFRVTNVQQAKDNAGAMKFRLSGDGIVHLDELPRNIQ